MCPTWKVKRIEIHPKYQKENYAYDVAVLLFDKIDLQKNLQVRPICLWKDNYDLNHIANTDGVVRKPIYSCFRVAIFLNLYFYVKKNFFSWFPHGAYTIIQISA